MLMIQFLMMPMYHCGKNDYSCRSFVFELFKNRNIRNLMRGFFWINLWESIFLKKNYRSRFFLFWNPAQTWDLVDVLLTIHDTLLTARGQRFFFVPVLCVFFVFAIVSHAVDTKWFLCSAPNVNVVRNSNKRGCGSLVKALASAWVGVPTAPVALQCGPRSPTGEIVGASFLCECLCTCTTDNRPWSWEFQHHEKSVCLDMCITDNRPWSCKCHSW